MRKEKGEWKNMLAQVKRVSLFFLFPFSSFILTVSCSGDINDINRYGRQQNPPDQTIKNARIHRSERGRLQVEIDAPEIARYSQPSAVTVYPKGVDLRFYDEQKKLKTTIHAERATSYDDRNIMKGSDSVVVVDYNNGDTIYMQDIIWRNEEDIIFSNHPVRAVNGNRVTYGDGFSSDEQLTNLRITRQRGVIEFNDD